MPSRAKNQAESEEQESESGKEDFDEGSEGGVDSKIRGAESEEGGEEEMKNRKKILKRRRRRSCCAAESLKGLNGNEENGAKKGKDKEKAEGESKLEKTEEEKLLEKKKTTAQIFSLPASSFCLLFGVIVGIKALFV